MYEKGDVVYNIGDVFYFVGGTDEELYITTITVNDNNKDYCDFSKFGKSPAEAIEKYKLELFRWKQLKQWL